MYAHAVVYMLCLFVMLVEGVRVEVTKPNKTMEVINHLLQGYAFVLCNIVLVHTMVCLVIVIAQVPGIYGSKQTESKGVARGRGLFTTAINPWPPVL